VIICGKRRVAKWEAGWTGDRAWVWEHELGTGSGGWLLSRWNGLDIDYGHVVRGCSLPNGYKAGIIHAQEDWPFTLLAGGIWWDDRKPPFWLLRAGIVYPPDSFSRLSILDACANDGRSGSWNCRATRPFWPDPVD
jgi:hypothetical protein